jgi:uncharacterized repeat protein (TIGR03803 family)
MNTTHWKSDVFPSLATAGDWTDDTGPASVPDTMPFEAGDGYGSAASATGVAKTKGPELTTLVSFTGADGANPEGNLIPDASGDLFGTTTAGGLDGDGTVFEITKTKHGYDSAPTTLAGFTGADGAQPYGSLIADAAGNLFGTASAGGADNDGTVFEIAKTRRGYASAPTTLVSFTGANAGDPFGSLIADAAGDLFGTTYSGGADNGGTVFEIAKTKGGYASAPTTLVSFTGADGADPIGSLIADAAGDLFGTTSDLSANGYGTVFEIAKTKGGYASAPTTLVSFTGDDGDQPYGSLIADAAGDLFGTTFEGGADGFGTVFEIKKTNSGYANAPAILVSFTGADGANPFGDLLADAAGNLFGTTEAGGADGQGTVIEIAKTKGGYAHAPTSLVTFTGADGGNPSGSLIADAAGDLFGTTYANGPNGDGTVFEITNSGFVPPTTPVQPAAHSAHASPLSAAFVQAMASFGASRSGETTPTFLAARHETSMQLSLPHQVA